MRACSERWLASQPAVGAAPPSVFARWMKATVLNRPDPSWLFARSRSQGIAPGSAVARWAMWRGRPGTPVPGRDREFCAEGGGLVTRSSPRHDDGRRRQVDRGPFLAVGVVGLERLRTGRWQV